MLLMNVLHSPKYNLKTILRMGTPQIFLNRKRIFNIKTKSNIEATHILAGQKKKDTALSHDNGEDSTLCNYYELERQLIKNFIKGLTKYIFLKIAVALDKKKVMYNSFLLLLHKQAMNKSFKDTREICWLLREKTSSQKFRRIKPL